MTDQTSAGSGNGNDENGGPAALPIMINAQYVKDLSFESPNAPHSLLPNQPQPQVDIGVDVRPQQLGEDVFEVTLAIRAEAKAADKTVFIVELSYGGIFTLKGIPQEHLRPVLMIEGPRLLFPFARAIVSETTRDGGFPPLMLNPIDFAELYRRQIAQAGAGGTNGIAQA
ncbi:protein-export chaperone SecB [Arenibaculum pallidiluteum]|uniref:protein-export chaperone SecB n=1 Tax=Arenibaculum pallidiluteum TaxID=2812559 RepID=UPI001A96F68F|nr:protein-export chaperone SecB [Arenibaculum pallidiluteum]